MRLSRNTCTEGKLFCKITVQNSFCAVFCSSAALQRKEVSRKAADMHRKELEIMSREVLE